MLQSLSVALPKMQRPPPPAGEVGHATRVDHQPTTKGGQPPRDIKTDQFGRATGLDIDDAAQSLGVEHDAPGHLRLDGDGAVDAQRRLCV
eukprot:scaffold34975_cov66-Phaeocystis_antarctica.AAC.4